MPRSARLFLCARCRDQVLLCSDCDRGQLYCGRACSSAARHDRRQEAARRYQNSRGGQLKHAARSACWRQRRRARRQVATAEDIDKVTHQGCPRPLADASLLACEIPSACESVTPSEPGRDGEVAAAGAVAVMTPVCRRCGHPLLPHVRLGWLVHNSVRRRSRHDHPC